MMMFGFSGKQGSSGLFFATCLFMRSCGTQLGCMLAALADEVDHHQHALWGTGRRILAPCARGNSNITRMPVASDAVQSCLLSVAGGQPSYIIPHCRSTAAGM